MLRRDFRLAVATATWLVAASAQAARVASMVVSPPGPFVVGQIVTITYTISNTGTASESVPFPMNGPTNVGLPSAAPGGAFTFQNWSGGSGGDGSFTSPVTIAAGGSYTVKWFARPNVPGTVTLSFSGTGAGASRMVSVLTVGQAHATGPGPGGIEIRNNILRLEHRTTALILVHGPAGGTVTLTMFGPSGVGLIDMATLTLDGNGQASFAYDGHGYGGSTGKIMASGLYWIVASGDVKDRKPLMILSYSDRDGSKDAY